PRPPAAPPRPSQPAALVRYAALLLLRPGVPNAKDSFPLTKTSCDVDLFTMMHRDASLAASHGVRDNAQLIRTFPQLSGKPPAKAGIQLPLVGGSAPATIRCLVRRQAGRLLGRALTKAKGAVPDAASGQLSSWPRGPNRSAGLDYRQQPRCCV